MHDILESKLEFEQNRLIRCSVLVRISDWHVRGTYVDNKRVPGYMSIPVNQKVVDIQFLQAVASHGREIRDYGSYFTGWEKYLPQLRYGRK